MVEWILVIFSIIILSFYLITLILLFKILSRVKEKTQYSFWLFIVSIFFLSAIRVLDVLKKSEIFFVAHLHEILVALFSLFLFMFVLSFYNILKKKTDR